MDDRKRKAALLQAIQALPVMVVNDDLRGLSDLRGGASRGWRLGRRHEFVQGPNGLLLHVTRQVLLDPPAYYRTELPEPTVFESLTAIGRAYLFAVFLRLANWVAKK
jgi:hypothetical protein